MLWNSENVDDLSLVSAHLTYDNINVTTAGEIRKERTSLPFDDNNPIPWNDHVPQNIKDAFPSPQDAIRYAIGDLYESDEHQYQLGTKTNPEG